MIQFVTLDPVFLTPPDTVIETKVYSLGLVSRLAHYVPYNRGVGICFKLIVIQLLYCYCIIIIIYQSTGINEQRSKN